MRYLVKYSKESDIKFISHLDLMRTIQRIVKRAGLPVLYSKGFNPHMDVSIAQPLSVGMYSSGEYMDLGFNGELDEEYVKERLNANAPLGVKIFEVTKVPERKDESEKKIPQAMALIDAAAYVIKIRYNDASALNEDIQKLLESNEWVTVKKSKSGEKTVDIKPMVKNIEYAIEDNTLIIRAVISAGSRENLSADLLSEYIKSKTRDAESDAFVDIKREEMYAYKDNMLVPLYKYI